MRRAVWMAVSLHAAACVCEPSVLSRVPSPDGRWDLAVYTMKCGATVADHRHVAVVAAGGQVPGEPNVLTIDRGRTPSTSLEVEAAWMDGKTVEVRFDHRARVFRQFGRAGDVEVQFAAPVAR